MLEASWKAAPPAERDLWQGLAQLAVGLTHALRGNARGAVALLRRGGQRVAGYAAPAAARHRGGAGRQLAAELADQIEHDGLAAAPPTTLRVSLRAAPADRSSVAALGGDGAVRPAPALASARPRPR